MICMYACAERLIGLTYGLEVVSLMEILYRNIIIYGPAGRGDY